MAVGGWELGVSPSKIWIAIDALLLIQDFWNFLQNGLNGPCPPPVKNFMARLCMQYASYKNVLVLKKGFLLYDSLIQNDC